MEGCVIMGEKISIETQYQKNAILWTRVEQEAKFSLEQKLKDENIKYHHIISRIKDISSLKEKVERKREQLKNIKDIIGLRVVCLFSSDLDKIKEIINEIFEVVSEDNKINNCNIDAFGYMSIHYIAQIRNDYVGPRYDGLKDVVFEIQVRTMLMDAWANVSHYLDYKSDKAVPKELKKDFYALSGLFYIADSHFEMFYNTSKQSQVRIQNGFRDNMPNLDIDINLDSLKAYLNMKFKNREAGDAKDISELVKEIIQCGYLTIKELDESVCKSWKAFLKYEEISPPSNEQGKTLIYTQAGIIRSILDLMNVGYSTRIFDRESQKALIKCRKLIIHNVL